jgi:hypothetical protein
MCTLYSVQLPSAAFFVFFISRYIYITWTIILSKSQFAHKKYRKPPKIIAMTGKGDCVALNFGGKVPIKVALVFGKYAGEVLLRHELVFANL